MINFWYVLPFPTRVVPTGTLTLATTASDSYSGTNGRQSRYCFTISNLDTANPLKLRTSNHVIFATIWPSVTLQFFMSGDFEVYNPNGTSVNYEIGEFFLDEGTSSQSGRATQFGPQGGAQTPSGPGGGGSSSSYGGGVGGGSMVGGTSGGSRGGTQVP